VRVINKDTSNKVLIKLNPIVAFIIKNISKKTVNNAANFLLKNNDDNIYTIKDNIVATIKIFHQVSGVVLYIIILFISIRMTENIILFI